MTRNETYQISKEIPLLGSHVIKSHSTIHEATDSVTRRKRKCLVWGKSWRRNSLTCWGCMV